MADKKLELGSKVDMKDKKVVVKKKVEDKIITITMAEGKRATATFTPNVRGHDVDVAAMRLKRMYRMYREQQRKEEEGK